MVFNEEEEAPTGDPIEVLVRSVAENRAKTEADEKTAKTETEVEKIGQFFDVPHNFIDNTINNQLIEELKRGGIQKE